MKTDWDIRKIEIKEFKEKLIEYFKKQQFDVKLSELFKELKLNLENLDLLQYCLDELVEEGYLEKGSCMEHYEYDLKEEYWEDSTK